MAEWEPSIGRVTATVASRSHSSSSTLVGASDEAERFLREAQLLAELRHPGIVSHVAHGQTPEGQRFLAMGGSKARTSGSASSAGP